MLINVKIEKKKEKKKLILHLSISQIAQDPNRLIFISYTCQLIIFGWVVKRTEQYFW